MTPTYRMPQPAMRQHLATLAEIINALDAARCSAQLAGHASRDFVVRELLLTAMQQIDRAAAATHRLR